MSYREYTDRNGNLQRRHNNGHRYTSNDQLFYTFRKPDDSHQWEADARKAFDELHDLVGDLAWRAWWEREFERDGKTADDFTWKYLCETTRFALEHPETLECGCVGDQSCSVCNSYFHALSVSNNKEVE